MILHFYSIARHAPRTTIIAVPCTTATRNRTSNISTLVASARSSASASHVSHLFRRRDNSAVPRLETIAIDRHSSTLTRKNPADPAMAGNSSNSSRKEDGDAPAPARPSASVVLLSPCNEVLLLRRVRTSTSFASAQVFPGGIVDPFHDGELPAEGDAERHRDGPAYRLCAVRETFEESGILLAKRDDDGRLVQLPEREREEARKRIHASEVKFTDWLKSIGAKPDTDSLIPFTRWLTPATMPKRFSTQMYLYFLPLTRRDVPTEMVVPTPDGGVEHTAAVFAEPQSWIRRARAGEIILFPPQHFVLDTLGRHIGGGTPGALEEESKRFMHERRRMLRFVRRVPTATTPLGGRHPSAQVAWADKVISPLPMYTRDGGGDTRAVLSLVYPGLELEGEGRVGDFEHVILAKFTRKGPTDVEVRLRQDVLGEDGQLENKRLESL